MANYPFDFPRDSVTGRYAAVKRNDDDSFHVPTVIYGADGKTPISADNPIAIADEGAKAELEAVKDKLEAIETRMDGTFDTQLTGSNVENLFAGAVTKTMLTGINRGRQYDTGPTSNPNLEPGESVSVVDVSGAGQGLYLRVAIDKRDSYHIGVSLEMDGSTIAGPSAASMVGRLFSIRSFDRAGLTEPGDVMGFSKILRWDEEADRYLIETDLSKFGTFQNSFSVHIVNDQSEEEGDVGIGALVMYKAVASPEVSISSDADVSPAYIREELSRKYGHVKDFTVIKTPITDSDGLDDGFDYTVIYRVDISKDDIENYIKSLL